MPTLVSICVLLPTVVSTFVLNCNAYCGLHLCTWLQLLLWWPYVYFTAIPIVVPKCGNDCNCYHGLYLCTWLQLPTVVSTGTWLQYLLSFCISTLLQFPSVFLTWVFNCNRCCALHICTWLQFSYVVSIRVLDSNYMGTSLLDYLQEFLSLGQLLHLWLCPIQEAKSWNSKHYSPHHLKSGKVYLEFAWREPVEVGLMTTRVTWLARNVVRSLHSNDKAWAVSCNQGSLHCCIFQALHSAKGFGQVHVSAASHRSPTATRGQLF